MKLEPFESAHEQHLRFEQVREKMQKAFDESGQTEAELGELIDQAREEAWREKPW